MKHNPFRSFNSSPEVIRLAVKLYIRYPLSLRRVEDLLFERGIDICHETVRYWWNRFGPMFAARDPETARQHTQLLELALAEQPGGELASPVSKASRDDGTISGYQDPAEARFVPFFLYTTTSTTNLISTAVRSSSSFGHPPWPSGVNWQPESHR